MNAPLRQPWTQERFLAWSGHQSGRYEFDGVQPVAMTGGTPNHSLITVNVLSQLRQRMRGGPCKPLGPDAAISTIEGAVRYPDALVTCQSFSADTQVVGGVVVVFEVLSPHTARTDRVVKVQEYAAVPSIRRYIMLESGFAGGLILARDDAQAPWIATTLSLENVLRLPELGIEIPIGLFYEDVDFSGSPEAGPDTSGR